MRKGQILEKRFECGFKRVTISDELSAFLTNNPEADTYVFIPHDGWKDEAMEYLGLDERDIFIDEYEDDGDDTDPRCLLLHCDSDYTRVIRLEEVRNMLMAEIENVEAL